MDTFRKQNINVYQAIIAIFDKIIPPIAFPSTK